MAEKSVTSCCGTDSDRLQSLGPEIVLHPSGREFIDEIPLAIFEIDLNGVFRYANKYAVDNYAGSPEEIAAGFSMLNLLAPEDRDRALSNMRNRLSGGDTGAHTYRGIRKDGRVVPVFVISAPIVRDGKPAGLRGIVLDLSDAQIAPGDLVRALQHLESRRDPGMGMHDMPPELGDEAYYRTLFDNVHDAILIFTPEDEIILDVNRQACELYGFPRSEMIGMSLKGISKNVKRGEEKIKRTLELGAVRNFETVQRRKDGTEIEIEVNASAIRLKGRTVILSVNSDVTARKRLEREKARLTAQLAQARKMDAISLMAGGIAHDFNNILTAIMGFAELGRMAVEANEPVGDSYDRILEASAKAARLTGQLLRISRRKHSRTKQVDVNALMRRAASRIGRGAAEVRLDLCDSLFRVRGDEEGIQQVIESLAMSAADAAGVSGSVTLATSNCPGGDANDPDCQDPARPMVRIAISDTGPGMDSEALSRVFDPFFSAEGFASGKGMELAVAYGIVRQHGGSIEAQSAPGQGSAFTVLLPADEHSTRETLTTGLGRAPASGGRSILLVEDDAGVLEMTRCALEGAGFSVSAFSSAEEAMAQLEKSGSLPDLVLTDVVLPGRTGTELAEKILASSPGMRVMFMSGYLSESDEWFAGKGRAFRILQKPFSMADMVKAVRSELASGGDGRD